MPKYRPPSVPVVGPGGIGEKENPDKRTVIRSSTTKEKLWDSTEPLRNILSKVKNFTLGSDAKEELQGQLMPGGMAASHIPTGALGAVFIPKLSDELAGILEKIVPNFRQMFGRELGVPRNLSPHSVIDTPLERSSWGSAAKNFYRDDDGLEYMFKKGGQAEAESAGGATTAYLGKIGGAKNLPPVAIPAESIATHIGDSPTGTQGSLQVFPRSWERPDRWGPNPQTISKEGGEDIARNVAGEYVIAPYDRNNWSNFTYNRDAQQMQPVDFGFPWDDRYPGRPYDMGDLKVYREHLGGPNKDDFFKAFDDSGSRIAEHGYSPTVDKLLELLHPNSWVNKDKAREIMQERLEFLKSPERRHGLWEDMHNPPEFHLAPHGPGGHSPPSQPIHAIDMDTFLRQVGLK